jgi:hypothetical protein
MWHAGELVLVLLLLTIAESVINAAPHVGRRGALSFVIRLFGYSIGIALMSVGDVAAITVQVLLLVLAAYMFRWFVASVVAYVRGPQLFEAPRKADLAFLAQDLSGLPDRRCAHAAKRILREHDGRVGLLGLILLAEEKGEPQELEPQWLDACGRARGMVRQLEERYGLEGATNALFLAELLCMYEPSSVESLLKSRERPALRGRASRTAVAHRLEKTGRVRRRAEEYGLPVEHKTKSGEPIRVPLSFLMKIWPPSGLAGAGFPGRGTALWISLLGMIAYGVTALAFNRNSGWVFLAVGVLVYILALLALSDFRELAARRKEWMESKEDVS